MLKANWSSSLTLACLLATMPAACASAKTSTSAKPSSNAPAGAALVHEIVSLEHAPAQQLAQQVQAALQPNGVRVMADTRANRVIVSGMPSDVAAACALIARLDTPAPAPKIQP